VTIGERKWDWINWIELCTAWLWNPRCYLNFWCPVDSNGFWWWCMTESRFFGCCPSSSILRTKECNIWETGCFHPQVRGKKPAMRLPTQRSIWHDRFFMEFIEVFVSSVQFLLIDGASGRYSMVSQVHHLILCIGFHGLGLLHKIFTSPFYISSTSMYSLSQFSCYLPSTQPGLRYLYCSAIEVSSFEWTQQSRCLSPHPWMETSSFENAVL
jgi:hypothetical protein